MGTLLPLDTWRAILDFNPWHFWGLAPERFPVNSKCNALLYKYSWQGPDRLGRDGIVRAIETAEANLRQYLLYDPAPRYSSDFIELPSLLDVDLRRSSTVPGMVPNGTAIKYPLGRLLALGTETLTVEATDVAITLIDKDGDGLSETFSITFPTTVTDPYQLAVFFNETDRDGDGPLDEYEIRPVKRIINDGEATITGKIWLLVRPLIYESQYQNQAALDPTEEGILAETLDVYVRGTDCENAANWVWASQTHPCWALEPCPDYSDMAGIAPARIAIRDYKTGLLANLWQVYNGSTSSWCGVASGSGCSPYPERIQVNVLAGLPLVNGAMNRAWQEIVARLAAAELGRPVCGCDMAQRELYLWQFDMSRGAGRNDEQYTISERDLSNPLGTRRGHIYAWHKIENMRLTRSVVV